MGNNPQIQRLMRTLLCLLLCGTILVACYFPTTTPQKAPTEPAQPSQPPTQAASPTATPGGLPTNEPVSPSPASGEPTQSGTPLPGFGGATDPFAMDLSLATWRPAASSSGQEISLPLKLDQVNNPGVTSGLTEGQKAFLAQNGFVVMHSQEAQFNDIRENVAERYGQPYYLTTDAAYHALHVTFDETLKALEAQYLRRQMAAITQATLQAALADLQLAQGTPIETDTRLAAAYLGVALRLFDPQAVLDPAIAGLVQPQIDQIMAGSGVAPSVLIPGFEDDYSAYKPVGHYAGQPALEQYFRGMTWFGRVNFALKSDQPGFSPSRAPLIITLALRQAALDGSPAVEAWSQIHAMLNFMIGPSDDPGPQEYATLMDQVYGPAANLQSLQDEAKWKQFLDSSAQLPAPQINSTFVNFSSELPDAKGWRFMGQRFTLDGFILQNLVFDKVGTQANPRKLPSGLDVMSAFGSSLAGKVLDEMGETKYENYTSQMSRLQQSVQAQTGPQWLDTFYSAWLYAFLPQVSIRTDAFPASMRTSAWSYKELNSGLGSWAELKHDTALYAKMPEMMGGGGPPTSGPAPAYVEPNPDVFYRLGYATTKLGEGLYTVFGWVEPPIDPPLPDSILSNGLMAYIGGLRELGKQLTSLGDLAAKELAGQPLTQEEWGLIDGCLGPVECQVSYSHTPYMSQELELPPVPVVATVAGAQENVLEAAVGGVDRLYAVVPINGKLTVAQGGVFSYYEFVQPRTQRLNDEEWRQRLANSPVQQPGWMSQFVTQGGKAEDVLAFNIGDIYLITEAGDKLNLREVPSTTAKVLSQFRTGDYLTIVDGPQRAGGYTWWKVEEAMNPVVSGWVVEVSEWYQRSTNLLP